MAFKLSRTGEYAVRLVTYLAAFPPDDVIPAKEIARVRDIPVKFLQQIISRFVKMGYLRGHPGMGGGVSMPESSRGLTLLDIIEAAEGPIFLNLCVMGAIGCPFSNACAVHLVWEEAQEALRSVLQSKTIAELGYIHLQPTARAQAPA